MHMFLRLHQLAFTSFASFFAVIAVLVTGCSRIAEQDLFTFTLNEMNDNVPLVTVLPEKVADGLNLTGFGVLRNELVVTSGFMGDYCLDIVDLVSGEVVRQLCRKGRGPGEFLAVSPFFSIEQESVIVYDMANGTVSEVLLSGDAVGSAIHQVRLEAAPGKGHPNIMSSYKVSEKELIAYNSIQGSAEFVSIDTPYYTVYDWTSGEEKQSFVLFDTTPLEKEIEWARMNAFALFDCLNNQRTVLCFAMNSMPVYGFLDIQTGKVTGFRIKGAPTFSADEPHQFFTGICAQGDFVYALYFGRPTSEHQPGTANTFLYKLDWDGRILKKCELEGLYRSCSATPDELFLSKVEENQTLCLYRLDISLL